MKRCACFFLVFVVNVMAQTDSVKNSLNPGINALQFQIDQSFRLTHFSGALFSYKYQMSDKKAWRLGISFDGAHSETSQLNRTLPADTLRTKGRGVTSNLNITLLVSIQRYINPKAVINFYYGYGLHSDLFHSWTDDEGYVYDYFRDGISIGPVAYLGTEWFFHKQMSLSGEYSISGGYTYSFERLYRQNFNDEVYQRIQIKAHTFNLGQKSVKLGLSVYY